MVVARLKLRILLVVSIRCASIGFVEADEVVVVQVVPVVAYENSGRQGILFSCHPATEKLAEAVSEASIDALLNRFLPIAAGLRVPGRLLLAALAERIVR